MPQLNLIESNLLPRPKLLLVFSGLAFALLICHVDQNAIGIALPTIGIDLNASTTIAWAGTSSMIANTIFQVLYGRLSDALGRKIVFLAAVSLLAVGNLLCSFAKTGPQLYVFRGLSGVGTGGVMALAMMIVSDIVSLEDRGKYQGILGACVGLGGVAGPFLAAAFVPHSTWRGIFWTVASLAFISGLIVAVILPPSKTTGSTREKLRTIDYWGLLASSTGLILLLIPISGGGIYFEWASPMVVSMLTLGSISMIVFVVIEWKFAAMPMVPLRLFRSSPIFAIISQQFLLGIVHYSQLYILPIFYQNARQFSTLKAATLMIPYVVSQSVFSVLSGQYISRCKRYGEVIWLGFTLWLLGVGLLVLFSRSTPTYAMIIILSCEGAGVGLVFQPTLLAAQAHSSKNDRAVVISVRNFSRALGGAVGLALSPAIFSNVLYNSTTALPIGLRRQVQEINLGLHDWSDYGSEDVDKILAAYATASRITFIAWVPIMALCLALCLLIKDEGLQRREEAVLEPQVPEVVDRNTQNDQLKRHGRDVEKCIHSDPVRQTQAAETK